MFLDYMYYAISVTLIMTENMRWVVCPNMCSYAHNASMQMALCVLAVNMLTFTPT